jgi:glucosamine--fructose-6-phosphate aminotransferase (isomerizing)
MSLITEIFEQPDCQRDLIQSQRSTALEIAEVIRKHDVHHVFLAARGTSYNAARYANYLWGSHNRLPIALATPSLFTYYETPPLLHRTLVVGISQSGESPDIISVLDEGHRQGCLTLAFTNAPKSPLAEHADLIFDIQAGEEKAVAATKTYTAQLAAIAMLSIALSGDEKRWTELEGVPAWVQHMITQNEVVNHIAQRYRDMY